MPLLSRKAKKKVHWLRRLIYSWPLSLCEMEAVSLEPLRMDGEYDDIDLDIDLVEGSIKEFRPDGVSYHTAEGEREVKADLVLLATGYRATVMACELKLQGQRFPFLTREASASEDPLPERHFLVDPVQPRLSYIGFLATSGLLPASFRGSSLGLQGALASEKHGSQALSGQM